MRLRWPALFLLLVFDLSVGHSQTLNTKVSFDVLFWKRELRLTTIQVQQIRSVNSDFYSALLDLHPSAGNIDAQNYPVLLELWKVAIADVLKTRQKRKWQKILAGYSSQYLRKECAL
jgi:hypothetical protein